MPTTRSRAPTIQVDTSAVGEDSHPPEIPLQIFPNEDLQQVSPKLQQHSPKQPSSTFLSVPQAPQQYGSRQGSFESGSSTTFVEPQPRTSTVESTSGLLTTGNPLEPDPGTENEFNVDNNSFAFTPGHLGKLIPSKSLPALRALGYLPGLEKGLRTDLRTGLSNDEVNLEGRISFDDAAHARWEDSPPQGMANLIQADTQPVGTVSEKQGAFSDRKRVFSDNRLPERKSKSLLQLMWMAYNDKVLILLSIAAVVSLAVGIYQSVDTAQNGDEAPVQWVEGVAIMVAIIIVVIVGSLNDWQKERQFVKLNKKKEDRFINAVRSGRIQEISVYDILVGDIVQIEPGDVIPVDGVFVEGHNVRCDESSATGESDLMKKTPAAEVMKAMENNQNVKRMDPFMLSGAKVTEGVGKFLVTATGIHSSHGKTMMSLRDEAEVTPLQSKLNVLAEHIAKLGGAAALLYFVVAFIEFLVRITHEPDKSLPGPQKGQQFLQIFILAVSIIVVAVPEGLPLAVTLALAFATTRMLKDNNLVRLLQSCETMGVATTVCSDKTGTLTQNKMTVVAGTIGTSFQFGNKNGFSSTESSPTTLVEESSPADSQAAKLAQEQSPTLTLTPPHGGTNLTAREFVESLDHGVREIMKDSIVLNSTAFESQPGSKNDDLFVGSKTETALLQFARDHLGMGPVATERSNAQIVYVVPFDSSRKCMATVVRLSTDKAGSSVYRIYVKGASEILLNRCSRILDHPSNGIAEQELGDEMGSTLRHTISSYAQRSLRTIGLTYRDFSSWPPTGVRSQEEDSNQLLFDDLLTNLTFLGVVGIQDPLRPGVTQAVKDCNRAGVKVRMVTGDNLETAKAIATECGIYTNGIVLEGPDFRKMTRTEMNRVIPELQVLARSSPEDKRVLAKRLKELGEVVAVTGDGTNDAPALKTADVGFSMGISGTEVAKEASAIILMDDNFASIVKALLWGRAVNDAVKKFLQFQVTVNITAVITTFVTGVSTQTPVLTAVQLLWVNLIMDTFAALALATDPPSPSMLDRKPDKKNGSLISVTMWKMIIGEAIWQLVVVFVLFYRGSSILNYGPDPESQAHLRTLIFNTFVWMQIFNAFNNRRLDNRFNILEGITKNWFFIGIIAIMVGVQIMIVFVGGAAISVTPLTGVEWAISVILGLLSIPIGAAIRLIPDRLLLAVIPEWFKREPVPEIQVEEDDRFEWNPALLEVKEQLTFLKRYKGGRLNHLKFKIQHPRQAGLIHSRPNSVNRTRSNTSTSANVAAAGIIAASIGGWSPVSKQARQRENSVV